MEKEALINIILSDLNEIQTLVGTFKGKENIQPAFINLTRTKINNIFEELNLLEQLAEIKDSSNRSESSLTSELPIQTIKEEAKEIAESASIIMSEEANNTIVETTDFPEVHLEKTVAPPTSEAKTKTKEKEDDQQEKEIPKVAQTIQPEPVIEKMVIEKIVQEEPKIEIKEEPSVSPKSSILGEQIKKEATSVNEQMGQHKELVVDYKQIGKPVDDIRKAIGLNDRFYYQRELFNGNADLFNQTLDQINTMDSFDAAVNFLQRTYQWEAENDASESFLKTVKRRFI